MRAAAYHCELAWLGGEGVERDVLVETARGVVRAVTCGAAPGDAVRLRGVTLPGLVDAHSHAFHRALRGRTHAAGSFWAWREAMYAVAARLDPDSLRALATAVFAEMALAGITCVGEFHYVHHGPGGVAYADPNETGRALVAAAEAAGVRLTLLDACYLAGGVGVPVSGVQERFSDRTAEAWTARVAGLGGGERWRVGAAVHSVRAVPRDAVPVVAEWARGAGAVLHAHVSEQEAENEACRAAYGVTPTRLLHDAGALGARTTAVHATHVTDEDVALLGGTRTGVCLCPTTERDLADGVGPAARLAAAGSPPSLGSDSQAVVDLLEEARAVELAERLVSGRRGTWAPRDLLVAATAGGARALGWPECGRIAVGAAADLVTVGLDGVRLAGARQDSLLGSLVFAATAADVTDVVVAGRRVVAAGRHLLVEDVPGALRSAVAAVLG